jgi:lysophospholipase L1-like esterase
MVASVLRKVLLALLTILTILFWLEIGLRVYMDGRLPNRFYEAHPRWGHSHLAGAEGRIHGTEYDVQIHINELGLRDEAHPYEKAPGVWRILILGDSFVEGMQVQDDEPYPQVLEALLEAQGRPVEVLNAGVSRYGTAHSRIFLEDEGLRYDPDVVIYAFYINDLEENMASGLYRLDEAGGLLYVEPGVSRLYPLQALAYDSLHFYRLGLAIYLTEREALNPNLLRTDWGLVSSLYRQTLLPSDQAAWALTGALLADMQALLAAQGIPFGLIFTPEQIQSENALWAQASRVRGENPPALHRYALRDALQAQVPPGAYFWDLTGPLEAAGQGESLYFDGDGHFNVAGHAFVADWLAQILAEAGLLP